jgi:hypothetical protein
MPILVRSRGRGGLPSGRRNGACTTPGSTSIPALEQGRDLAVVGQHNPGVALGGEQGTGMHVHDRVVAAYTTRDSSGTAGATSWVLPAVGMPLPMSGTAVSRLRAGDVAENHRHEGVVAPRRPIRAFVIIQLFFRHVVLNGRPGWTGD